MNMLWRCIPGPDMVSKVSFVSAVLGILGFGAYIYDTVRDTDRGATMSQQQITLLARELIGKASADARPLTQAELDAKAAAIRPLSLRAESTSVKLGDVQLSLEPPSGHCFLDAGQPSDARLIGLLQSIFRAELRMLAGFADCAQLKSWRTGGRKVLDDFGQYLVPVQVLAETYQGSPEPMVQEVCKTMREQGQSLLVANQDDVKKRIKDAMEGAAMNEMTFVGVLAEDSHACYFGSLQKLTTEFGDAKSQANVTSIVFIGGKVMTFNIYAPYDGEFTFTELLDRQKTAIAQNAAINGT